MLCIERGRYKYSSHRDYVVFCTQYSAKLFAIYTGICCISNIYFRKACKKYTTRINNYDEESHFFLKFFDKKAFEIMALMMTVGVWLRVCGVAPERFIAVFYTGLRASLLLAGILFGVNYGIALSDAAKEKR